MITENGNGYLTWEKVIELGGAVVAILTPMIGLVIFIETKFISLDKRLSHIESHMSCVVQAITTDSNPSICVN